MNVSRHWLERFLRRPLDAQDISTRLAAQGAAVDVIEPLNAGLGDIRVPTLVVHHKDDTCRASPYSGAEDIMKALKRAPVKELMAFEGGSPAISAPCEAKAPHGYLGIEAKVVSAIGAWIRAH